MADISRPAPILRIINGRLIETRDLGPAPLWWYRTYVNGCDGSVVTECGPVERTEEPVR